MSTCGKHRPVIGRSLTIALTDTIDTLNPPCVLSHQIAEDHQLELT